MSTVQLTNYRLYIDVQASQIFEDDPARLEEYDDFDTVFISETYQATSEENAIADALMNWDISKNDISDIIIEDKYRDLEIEAE